MVRQCRHGSTVLALLHMKMMPSGPLLACLMSRLVTMHSLHQDRRGWDMPQPGCRPKCSTMTMPPAALRPQWGLMCTKCNNGLPDYRLDLQRSSLPRLTLVVHKGPLPSTSAASGS